MFQEAKKLDLIATNDDVDGVMDQTILSSQLTEKEFKQYLEEQNLTLKDMKKFYKLHISIDKLLEEKAYKDINITFEETQEFYNDNLDVFRNTTFGDVKEQVTVFLTQQAQAEASNNYITELIENADIKIIEEQETSIETFSSEEVEKYSNCAVRNGLTKDTVVFVYSDSCPHCVRMQPIVTDLGLEDYRFKWASVEDDESKALLRECFSDVIAGGVPQFICSKNGQTLVGEKPKEVLKAFAESCR